MKFVLEIECDNDAFAIDQHDEIARILKRTATSLDKRAVDDFEALTLRDFNGNTVGSAGFRDTENDR